MDKAYVRDSRKFPASWYTSMLGYLKILRWIQPWPYRSHKPRLTGLTLQTFSKNPSDQSNSFPPYNP